MGEANAPVPLCLCVEEKYSDDFSFILKQIYEAIYDGFPYHLPPKKKEMLFSEPCKIF